METADPGVSASLTRWADSSWPRLQAGQWITITRSDGPSTWRVVKVVPHEDGSESYELEPFVEPASPSLTSD